MATLAQPPLAPERPAAHGPSRQPGEWGLLLIPVLLCVGDDFLQVDQVRLGYEDRPC